MKLIPDARLFWRFNTVQAAALLALLSAVQAELLPLVQPLVPAHWWPYVSAGVALLIIVLRIRAQPALEGERARQEAERQALEADRIEMDRMEAEMLARGETYDHRELR